MRGDRRRGVGVAAAAGEQAAAGLVVRRGAAAACAVGAWAAAALSVGARAAAAVPVMLVGVLGVVAHVVVRLPSAALVGENFVFGAWRGRVVAVGVMAQAAAVRRRAAVAAMRRRAVVAVVVVVARRGRQVVAVMAAAR